MDTEVPSRTQRLWYLKSRKFPFKIEAGVIFYELESFPRFLGLIIILHHLICNNYRLASPGNPKLLSDDSLSPDDTQTVQTMTHTQISNECSFRFFTEANADEKKQQQQHKTSPTLVAWSSWRLSRTLRRALTESILPFFPADLCVCLWLCVCVRPLASCTCGRTVRLSCHVEQNISAYSYPNISTYKPAYTHKVRWAQMYKIYQET